MNIEEISKNKKIMLDDIPYNVDDVDFMKPGKGSAVYRIKFRNLMDGGILERTFHSGDKLKEADVSTYDMQYLYHENGNYIFMNTDTFEQHFMAEDRMGSRGVFLKDGMVVPVQLLGDNPIEIILPNFIEVEVMETSMSTGKETVTAQNKPAKLSNGMEIGVPTFMKAGDVIRVDTRTGAYVERVGNKK